MEKHGHKISREGGKKREEKEKREERGEEVEGENDGPVEGGEDDSIMRVKSNKEWWGAYEKNAKIARYCSTVKRTICAIKRWLMLMNVPFMSHITQVEIENLLTLICALVNLQLEVGSFCNW